MTQSIQHDAVIEVTNAVCESLLGDVPEARDQSTASPEGISAWVTIRGAWSGNIEVRLSSGLARRLTRELMCTEASSNDDADLRDVVGELANMIGGNLKALLPEPCALSLPSVATMRPAATPDLVQAFSLRGDAFEVRVSRERRI